LRDIKMLDDGGYIDAETAYLLNDLALLSNRVLHKSSAADEVTYADALEYGRLAKRMLQRLAEVKIP
jgi:uncharacterized protein YutE (UPF0331/DUF86 family)